MEEIPPQKTVNFDYSVVPTVKAFTQDNHFIKGIIGPIGSGKSSGCVMDLFNRAVQQQPDSEGVRKTRFCVIRGTYQQLKDTTKKTAEEWLPFATWKEFEHKFIIDVKLTDGTTIYSEWLFRALDRPDQVGQFLSMELTGSWINEAKESPKEIFDTIQTRVGRYPKKIYNENNELIYGPSWSGVIMDTNPPDTDHWWYKFFEEDKPQVCKTCRDKTDFPLLFLPRDKEIPTHCPKCGSKEGDYIGSIYYQPSGLSDEAENLKYLPDGYYQKGMAGKDPDFIKVFIEGKYGYLKDGRPVFPNYNDQIHITNTPTKPFRGVPLIIGLDMGLTPAAIITQLDPRNRLWILDELQGQSMAIREFCELYLKPLLRTKYLGFEHIIIGDPSGNIRSQADARTVYQELRSQGLKARPAVTNSIQPRLSSVNSFLTRMVDGKPAFILDANCKLLRKGLLGGYSFRRLKISGERFTDVPDKNEYSHICDALEYACLEQERGFDPFNNFNNTLSNMPKIPEPSKLGWT